MRPLLLAPLLLACSTPPAEPPPAKDAAPDGPVDYFGRCTCVPPSPGFEFGCVALCDSPAGQHTVTCNQRANTCFSQRGGEIGGQTTPSTSTSGCDICRIAVNEGGLGRAIYTDAGVPDAPAIPDVPRTSYQRYMCDCTEIGNPLSPTACQADCRTASGQFFSLYCGRERDALERCRWSTPGSGTCATPMRPDTSRSICGLCVASINEGCGASGLAQ